MFLSKFRCVMKRISLCGLLGRWLAAVSNAVCCQLRARLGFIQSAGGLLQLNICVSSRAQSDEPPLTEQISQSDEAFSSWPTGGHCTVLTETPRPSHEYYVLCRLTERKVLALSFTLIKDHVFQGEWIRKELQMPFKKHNAFLFLFNSANCVR